jgi:hypothetical protein
MFCFEKSLYEKIIHIFMIDFLNYFLKVGTTYYPIDFMESGDESSEHSHASDQDFIYDDPDSSGKRQIITNTYISVHEY